MAWKRPEPPTAPAMLSSHLTKEKKFSTSPRSVLPIIISPRKLSHEKETALTMKRRDSIMRKLSRKRRKSSLKAALQRRTSILSVSSASSSGSSSSSSSAAAPPSTVRWFYKDMLTFPTELHAQILKNASLADLCAFRTVCKTFQHLVSSGEIVRKWLGENGDPQLTFLYPPPDPPTFHYVLENHRRHSTAVQTATLLAGHIEQVALRQTLERLDVYPEHTRAEVFAMITQQVQEALVPLLLTLQHYLGFVQRMWLEGMPSQYEINLTGGWRATEREILESYDPEHLLQVHRFWLFLCWLFNHILVQRPDGISTQSDNNTGRPRELPNRYQWRLMLVLGNMPTLQKLLKLETARRRLSAIKTWLRLLDPELSILWRRGWRQSVSYCDVPETAQKALSILHKMPSIGDIWVDGATAVLVEKGFLSKSASMEVPGSPWQALDFLCDVAGYDALQAAPSLLRSPSPQAATSQSYSIPLHSPHTQLPVMTQDEAEAL